MFVAVDFGKRVSGLAVLTQTGELLEAREVHVPSGRPRAMAAALFAAGPDPDARARWVGERMQDREGKSARAGDLETLRDVARELQALTGRLALVAPSAWKGNVPKRITSSRILRELAVEEIDRIAELTKETLDAIGIGLWVSGRLGRGMTQP